MLMSFPATHQLFSKQQTMVLIDKQLACTDGPCHYHCPQPAVGVANHPVHPGCLLSSPHPQVAAGTNPPGSR